MVSDWLRMGLITLCGLAIFLLSCESPCAERADMGLSEPREALHICPGLTTPVSPLPVAHWTVLFYDAADYEFMMNPRDEFATAWTHTSSTNVLILEDPFEGEARMWRVSHEDEGALLTCVADLGEIDMGDGATLESAVSFCQEWFPSQRIAVLLYDHGHAWRGACGDENRPGESSDEESTLLSPGEMHQAFARIGGIDALLFTAPCIMGALETAYEVRDVTRLYVASEAISGYVMWMNALSGLSALLEEEPDMASDELGRRIVDLIQETYSREDYPVEIRSRLPKRTVSAVASDELVAVAQAVSNLAARLIDGLPLWRSAILAARLDSTDFGIGEMVDLGDFARHCATIPGMGRAAASVLDAIGTAVLHVTTDEEAGHSSGLSIYFPMFDVLHPEYSESVSLFAHGTNYAESGLLLAQDTLWDEFLRAFFFANP